MTVVEGKADFPIATPKGVNIRSRNTIRLWGIAFAFRFLLRLALLDASPTDWGVAHLMIVLASLATPRVPAVARLTREDVGAPPTRRAIRNHLIKLIRLAAVLARDAVKDRWERDQWRLSDGADQHLLVH